MKNEILENIRKNKPSFVAYPKHNIKYITYENKTKQFINSLKANGANAKLFDNLNEINSYINENFKDKNIICDVKNLMPQHNNALNYIDPHDLSFVNLYITKGHFGVAENGAIWFKSKSYRTLFFIVEYSFFIIEEKDIFNNMNEACEHIDLENKDFGTFICGPSKTADIEQSLVIGAHGAKESFVAILKS